MDGRDRALLVIGSGLKLYREYLVRSAAERAAELGLALVLVNNLRPTWQTEHFAEITQANIFDHDTLKREGRAAATRWAVEGVLCWDEPLVQPSAELADELGVPGLTPTGVMGCRDKHLTRATLTAAGLPQPAYALTTTLDEARAAAHRIGYPVVVKPRALGASMGVVLATTDQDLTDAFRVADTAGHIGDEPFRGDSLIEEYIEGPEISIDGAVHKGEYLPMFVARKTTGHPPYFEETGHTVDANDPLLVDTALMDTIAAAHRALSIANGLTHTEVKLTPTGPTIIEINGRLGGDLIPYLGKLATGIDPGTTMVDVALGLRPDTTPTTNKVAGIRFAYPETDCVVDTITLPTPHTTPNLTTAAAMVPPGTHLRLPPAGYIARHAFVICETQDPSGLETSLDKAMSEVHLTATPLPPLPPGTPPHMPEGLLDADD